MDLFEGDTYMELTTNALSSAHRESSYVSSNESLQSCGNARDLRISELEEKLAMAEDRCTVLRNQVAYMKMLYTNNNKRANTDIEDEPLEAGGEYRKIQANIRNSLSNPHKVEPQDLKEMPANMTVKPIGGTTLTRDPKEAMQMIVNEMTQSVNAIEGGVNIHSNTIEGVVLSSREKKKRTGREDQSGKMKKNPANQPENAKNAGNRTTREELLGSKSKASVNSIKTVKRRPISKFNAGSRAVSIKCQESPEVKDRGKKQVAEIQKSGSEAMMPKSTSSTYLLPTLSYRMKCVPKSHRREYSFHRIPFVLGKSTNKSHNLGARIQETLSMIKQSRKGFQSSAMGKKEELNNLLQDPTDPTGAAHVVPSAYRSTTSSQSKARTTPVTSGATNDYKNYQLRTVLMNLHDEFSKMTENYESLKASMREKFDPQLALRIQNLEEELNAKEIEINAFMNLYNEVSQLKDQMNNQPSSSNAIYRPASCYTESTSTLKMTRLLRRIEQFQNQLKTISYV